MPPETLSLQGYCSEGVNTIVDAWALGCVLYFCFHGKPPFYGETAQVLTLLISDKSSFVLLL
jgi:serine/threonine protein kinase